MPDAAPSRNIGLALGPVLAGAVALIPSSTLSFEAHALAALTVLMATWWMTEALPVAITALIPLGLFPILGIQSAADTAPAYGHNLVWLFFGGFQLAFAIERWGLHRRSALFLVSVVGTRADRMVLGFMLAAGLLSMWLLNTSTTLMMLPVGMAVADAFEGHEEGEASGPFGKSLMLGIAYAASVGGMATYVGTAPNGIFAGVADSFGVNISFGAWFLYCGPLAMVLLFGIWLYLTRVAFKVSRAPLPAEHPTAIMLREPRGPWSPGEKRVGVVFLLIATAWIIRTPLTQALELNGELVTDTTIGIVGTLLLYLVTVPGTVNERTGRRQALLSWDQTVKTPWHILLLFGGGFALAGGFQVTGLSVWVGGQLAAVAAGWPVWGIILTTVLMVTFLTEVTSNTATATVLLPVIGGLAVAMDLSPALLMLPATLAASCAFMLPVATPPNAIVYASGRFSLRDMSRVGFWINIGSALVITGWVVAFGVPTGG